METADLVFRTLCFRILFYLGPSLSGSCACTSTRHRPCRLLSVVRSSTVQNGPLEITTFRARKFNSVLSRAVGGIASRREESLRTYVCYMCDIHNDKYRQRASMNGQRSVIRYEREDPDVQRRLCNNYILYFFYFIFDDENVSRLSLYYAYSIVR